LGRCNAFPLFIKAKKPKGGINMKSKGIFEVPAARIEVIQGLLPRIYTHTIEEKVQEYQEAMAEGQEFPAITVWDKDGHYWLIDGMHRLIATKRLGKEHNQGRSSGTGERVRSTHISH
jgi:uncharacterized ParB-like nuclease family protein